MNRELPEPKNNENRDRTLENLGFLNRLSHQTNGSGLNLRR
jgi:hypothetical protein